MVVAGMVKEEVVLVVMITVMMILFPWPCGKHFPYIITLNVSFQEVSSVSLYPSTFIHLLPLSKPKLPSSLLWTSDSLLTVLLVANLVYTISPHYSHQKDHLKHYLRSQHLPRCLNLPGASPALGLKSQFFATIYEALWDLTLLTCQTSPPASLLLAQGAPAPSFSS